MRADVALVFLVLGAAGAPQEVGMSGSVLPEALQRARAHWVSRDTVLWDVVPTPGLSFFLLHAREALDPASPTTPRVPLEPAAAVPAEVRERFPQLAAYTPFTLAPEDARRAAALLKDQLAVVALAADGALVMATSVQIPGALDSVFPYDGPLGVTWEGGGVPTVRLWAPTARSVRLRLFDTSSAADGEIAPMSRNEATGVWAIRGTPAWNRKFYLFDVEVFAPSTGRVERNLVTDPYSLSLSTNGRRSQIVDLEDPSLRPEGWTQLTKPPLASPVDAVIYELHVRDFSIRDRTVPARHRGTFLAFTHEGSDGMRHLRDLARSGLTHVHLLPAFDFATVNENRDERQEPDEALLRSLPPDSDRQAAIVSALRDKDGFNWGYDPLHYGAPEGSYSTDPDGPARIVEFRRMVQGLAGAGLRVVMDVVYNHTHAHGQDPESVLDRIVPGYYHRLDGDGKVQSSTCCSNTATEHRMMERLMVDTVVTWARAYKVDGFRFDIMAHHMVSNMTKVRAALDALTLARDGVDGPSLYLYGEGWDFGEVAGGALGRNASQLNMAGTGIGTFSDRLRDAVRGGGAFAAPQEQGFATGLAETEGEETAIAEEKLRNLGDLIRVGLAGNLRDFRFVGAEGREVTGSEVDYHGKPAGYAALPQEHVVYVSAHDNETLFDAIQWKAPAGASVADRVRMNNLALSFVALSQGVPFFHAGDDMLRSKSLDRNSYDSGDWWNKLDFTYATNNWGVGLPPGENEARWPLMRPLLADPRLAVTEADIRAAMAHFREMLRIRRSSRLFRLRTAGDVQRCVRFLNTGPSQIPGLIVMTLEDRPATDAGAPSRGERIVVLFNARGVERAFVVETFRGAGYALHDVQARSADPVVRRAAFDTRTGRFLVPARTTAVFTEYEGRR